MADLISLGILAAFCLIGFLAGTFNEKRHYRSIIKREGQLSSVLMFSGETLPDDHKSAELQLVTGSTVVAEDYFKALLAKIRGIIGGRVGSYESLLDRGRREAILRMKEQAHDAGYDFIANVRLETASVYKNARSGMGSLEVFAYGTALK